MKQQKNNSVARNLVFLIKIAFSKTQVVGRNQQELPTSWS